MSGQLTAESVWRAWNDLPDDHPAPVKQIARDLGMSAADVAFIVYPAEAFGAWDDSDEPDPPSESGSYPLGDPPDLGYSLADCPHCRKRLDSAPPDDCPDPGAHAAR